MKHDRNGKKQSKTGSGNNRPSKPNGKVRAKADSNHGSKRKEAKAEQAPAGRKSPEKASATSHPAKQAPTPQSDPAARAIHEEKLIGKAREWAELHSDPHTRGAMDKVLNGLSEADKRRVVLCGQRIAAGMSVRLVK